MITKNTQTDGRRQMTDGIIGIIPGQEENRFYDAEEYALTGLGYEETDLECECDLCKRETLQIIMNTYGSQKDES